MTWTEMQNQQPAILDRLCADFRHLNSLILKRSRDDWTALVVYFARTYDLTVSEAGETLDDWLMRRFKTQALIAA